MSAPSCRRKIGGRAGAANCSNQRAAPATLQAIGKIVTQSFARRPILLQGARCPARSDASRGALGSLFTVRGD
eukprot:8181940-Pyramimonas_sp.AAC.1